MYLLNLVDLVLIAIAHEVMKMLELSIIKYLNKLFSN